MIALVFMNLALMGPLEISTARSLDFGWGTPIELNEKMDKKGQKHYLVWPIEICNRTAKRWLPQLDIVAVTDTGRQYAPAPDLKEITSEDRMSLAGMHTQLFPSVIRKAIAVFEEIDSKAKVIHFYVGGLVDIPQREMKYLRITYKRSPSGWRWEESGALE